MKNIDNCIKWIEYVKGLRPNVEDLNYLNSIETYLKNQKEIIEKLEEEQSKCRWNECGLNEWDIYKKCIQIIQSHLIN